jgi:WD40 repeat protein
LLGAGLEGLLHDLDLRGSPREFVILLVDRLDKYGALADGQPALVALLQEVAGQVGANWQAHVQHLCERIIAPPELGLAACPYRGLEVFREQDAAVFFGRADVVATLQQMVAQQPFVALIGASGSGKSSVVYAGLLPYLRKQPGQLIAAFRPGTEPFRAVAAAVLPLLEPELTETERLIELRKLADALTQAQLSLSEILERIRQKSQPAPRLLLFTDQFEELYTLCPAGASRQRFLDGMLQTCEVSKTSQVSWLLTLRADFLAQVLDYDPLAKMLDKYPPKLLGRMNEEQLRTVIEDPAHKAGVTLEASLSDHILREVGQEPGNLPLLEFALTALWQRMTGRCLTHAAYEAIGGVNQALTRHADAVLAGFATPEDQAQVRRIMVQLVSPGASTEDTRQVATRDQVKDWDVVQRLADKRLVVTGRQDETGVETVEVVHEALIRHWQPLRDWMKGDRTFRVWQNGLRQANNEWEQTGKDDGALLRGVRLANAEEKLAQFADALSEAEKTYIKASVALRQQEQEARERAQRERLRWRITFGLVAGLLIALVLASFAGFQWQRAKQQTAVAQQEKSRAEQEKERAEQQTKLAQQETTRAEQEKTRTEAEKIRAEEQKNTALETQSLFLADLARQENEKQNYTNAILLALEALPQNMAQPDRPYVPEDEVQLYTAATNLRERLVLTGHDGPVNSAAFSPDGTRIVTASDDHTARVWDSVTGKELATLTVHTGSVNSVAFSPNGMRIVTASADNTARVWDAATGKEIARLTGHEYAVNSAAFSPDGTRIVTASNDNTVLVWNATTGKEIARLTGHKDRVWSAAFSPDGTRIVTASDDKTARVWDISPEINAGAGNGNALATLAGHKDRVWSAAFSPDGTRIVTASGDQTARVWDAATGQALATLTGHEGSVSSAAFSPDGTRIVTASEDQTARVWDTATGQALSTLTGHEYAVNSAAFSPDGTRIVTASKDNTVRVWDAATGKEIARLTGHKDRVWSAAFSPDGTRIVTASDDKTARVWDAATGKEIARLTGHEYAVNSAAFSPDGTRIVTASNDKTARVWDAATGKEIARLTGHTGLVLSAAFSPDGTRLVTASEDKTARVWRAFTTQELVDYANSIVPRRLTPEERKKYFLE